MLALASAGLATVLQVVALYVWDPPLPIDGSPELALEGAGQGRAIGSIASRVLMGIGDIAWLAWALSTVHLCKQSHDRVLRRGVIVAVPNCRLHQALAAWEAFQRAQVRSGALYLAWTDGGSYAVAWAVVRGLVLAGVVPRSHAPIASVIGMGLLLLWSVRLITVVS